HTLRTPLSVVANELELFRPFVPPAEIDRAKRRLLEALAILSSLSGDWRGDEPFEKTDIESFICASPPIENGNLALSQLAPQVTVSLKKTLMTRVLVGIVQILQEVSAGERTSERPIIQCSIRENASKAYVSFSCPARI